MIASDQLQSAAVSVEAEVHTPQTTSGSIRAHASLQGVLQNGGRSMQAEADVKGSVTADHATHAFRVTGDVVTEQGTRIYARLRSASIDPPYTQHMTDVLYELQGPWWQLPSSSPLGSFMTPDPNLLQNQADIVRVTRDRGIQRIHGRDVYRYDVTLDPVRLLFYLQRVAEQSGQPFDKTEVAAQLLPYEAAGELWIDAETFAMHRVHWRVLLAGAADPVLDMTTELTRHNIADPVQPPADAQDLSVESLATLFSRENVPVDLPDEDPILRDIFR